MNTRRKLLVALSLSSLAITTVYANDYPSRPVRLVVPYAPGGSADIVARRISEEWSKQLGGSIYVENKAGAGGNIGVNDIAKAAPDGYSVGLQTVSLAINPAIFKKMPYDTLKEIAPVGMVATSQHVLIVNNNFPARTTAELVKAAKAAPGKFNYGSAGSGSTFHMSAELFKTAAGVDITHIPYKGGGPALIDTIAGQVDMSFPVLIAAQPHIQAGKVRALGVTGSKRSSLMPDVPTLAESGVPHYNFETWFIAFVPAGTPKDIIEKLNTTLNKALNNPAIKERMVKEGFDPIPSTPQQAQEKVKTEMDAWARLVKARGITAE